MRRFFPLACVAALFAGCIHIDPIEVHAVVDVNVKVDREVSSLLTDLYGDATPAKTSSPTKK